ncbi:hypothetical protein AMK29_19810 [Streptomyces sp. CB02261]|nr:hypothetical protein AMK29_19810 [Streptomyces sp. CB02261]
MSIMCRASRGCWQGDGGEVAVGTLAVRGWQCRAIARGGGSGVRRRCGAGRRCRRRRAVRGAVSILRAGRRARGSWPWSLDGGGKPGKSGPSSP